MGDNGTPAPPMPLAWSRSSGTSGPSLEPCRRGEPWFDDGNIILQAGDTMFKVHMGVLAKHSLVFKDLSTIPQPVDAQNHGDTPIAELHDHPKELARLLDAFYCGPIFLRNEMPDFASVTSLLRIGHKYTAESLCEDCLGRLRKAFPLRSAFPYPFRTCEVTDHLPGFVLEDAIEVVNLARLICAADLLPAALYVCCQLDHRTLLHRLSPFRVNGTDRGLSLDDLERCLDGRVQLCRIYAEMSMKLFGPHDPTTNRCCTAKQACPTNKARMLESFAWPSSACTADVMDGHLNLWMVIERAKVCESCEAAMHDTHGKVQKAVWKALPTLLRLEGVVETEAR
ncbi:uncharacterized protein C8Q71DRAFT_819801 [Rhodofomes roseus]|uniref:BTB domain-containing protein n=1 Tax=Rhodofomes roseus TaxID=34475 RepID=A0ABQ8L167_9APHY|nr:uncharacterized protein C8Q71DRAFT_819801 [Rhodofomes roseus]KAH9844282.1 hypothetical protein C8Q71DRAFT_819801 [Rhodofomes roseus]